MRRPGALYISDLDGTLLNPAARLSSYSLSGLRRMLAQGLRFTVASARGVAVIQTMLRGVKLPLPVIELNGAFVSDLATGRHEIVENFAPPLAEKIYLAVRRSRLVPFIATFDGSADWLYHTDCADPGMRWYLEDRRRQADPRLRRVNRLSGALREQVVCLAIIGPCKALSTLHRQIRERFETSVVCHFQENLYSPGWYWLTLHPHRATKANAIKAMLRRKKLETRELVVFGDQINDLDMFRIADRSIAVGNAIDELKQAATRVIGSNGDDGVIRFIENEWRPRHARSRPLAGQWDPRAGRPQPNRDRNCEPRNQNSN